MDDPESQAERPRKSNGQPLARITTRKVPADQAIPGNAADAARIAAARKGRPVATDRDDGSRRDASAWANVLLMASYVVLALVILLVGIAVFAS